MRSCWNKSDLITSDFIAPWLVVGLIIISVIVAACLIGVVVQATKNANEIHDINERGKVRDSAINQLRTSLNGTDEIDQKQQEQLDMLLKKAAKNSQDIELLSELLAATSATSFDILARLKHEAGAMSEMARLCVDQRFDPKGAAPLFNKSELAEFDSEDTFVDEMSTNTDGSLYLSLIAARKSVDAEVLKVQSFDMYSNKSLPVVKHYSGPSYVLHNRTSNYMKGIVESESRYLVDTYNLEDYRDPRLESYAELSGDVEIQPQIIKT